jgi:hypothetical protein
LPGADGAPGAAGPTGATGSAGLTWKGTWISATAYNASDAVSFSGNSYIALNTLATSTVDPATDSANWQLFASKGDAGTTGATGSQGPAGVNGSTGPQGPQGLIGATGPQGLAGTSSWSDGSGVVSTTKKIGVGVVPDYDLDIIAPNNGLIRIASSVNDNTLKAGRMVLRHYSNAAALPVYVFGSASTAANNFVAFGGGSTVGYAATQLDFYTAADNVTPLGTSRLTIASTGNIGIGTAVPAQSLDVNGGMRLSSTSAHPVTCGSTVRGTFWFDQTGTDDAVYVCARITGVYAWKKVTLQ